MPDDSSRLIEDIIEIGHAVRRPSVIDAENLTKRFGDLTAVEDLTLHVDEGEVFGFLGPNGAGKTTVVRMLCCLISKTSGKAKMGDYEVGNSLVFELKSSSRPPPFQGSEKQFGLG